MSIDLDEVVGTAFAALKASVKGSVKTLTYKTAGTQVYNPTTGVVANTGATYTDIPATLLAYKRQERETDFQNSRRQTIEFGDQKCLIQYSKLPITVSMEDRLIISGSEWRIVSYEIDPTGAALHTFQIRQA